MRTALFLLALAAAPVFAQPLVVTGRQPADGAVAVPLNTTVSFTFSAPLDPAALPGVAFTPDDQIVVGDPTLSGDGRTVSYSVTHQPNTAYVHLVLTATGANGDALERPAALNYTTSTSAGSGTISGTITVEGGSPDGAVVLLATGDLSGQNVRLARATVLTGPSGNYSLGPVPTFAAYVPGGFTLPNPEAGRVFTFGFRDTNGDGTPDPILLFGSSSGNNFTLTEPDPVTAAERLAEAQAEAASEAPDNGLVLLPATAVDATGRAPLWTYVFYSPANGTTTTVLPTGLVAFATTEPAPDGSPTDGPVPVPFADSPDVLTTAEGAGGSAFRAEHAGDVVVVTMRGGHFADENPPAASAAFWRVDYRALDGETGPTLDSLGVFVDMATGVLLGTTQTAVEGPTAGSGVTLGRPFPNPSAGGEVAVPFGLDRPARVRLVVLDVLGREVAVLENAVLPAGVHRLAWQPGAALAPGLYVLRLEAGAHVATRRLVVSE